MGKMMKKYAVITGASSGIGKEFARQLSQEGYHLILTARNEKRLNEIKEKLNHCEIFVADLSKQEDIIKFFNNIKDRKIDIFINNAGFGDCSYFLNGNLDKEINMIDVNVKAVHILTKLILKKMQTYDKGYILNVSSSAGLLPAGPYMATYYATKSYVCSLTTAIARELKEHHSHVYIGALCPGPVDTEFNRHANVEFALKGISTKKCVLYALKKMKKRKVIIVPTITMKLSVFCMRILSRNIYASIVSHQQKKKKKI